MTYIYAGSHHNHWLKQPLHGSLFLFGFGMLAMARNIPMIMVYMARSFPMTLPFLWLAIIYWLNAYFLWLAV